jgi:hypothetical protein
VPTVYLKVQKFFASFFQKRRPSFLWWPTTHTRRGVLSAIAAAVFINRASAAGAPPTKVLVIPSIHKRLAGNPHYTYDDLYALIAAFKPDLVGVEIRQQDMPRQDAYLHHNYPAEMVALAHMYHGRVFGFDWLGQAVAGRDIPDDWWTRQSPIKHLERSCASAPSTTSPRLAQLNAQLDALSRQQDRMADTGSAASLADGSYDRVTASYYQTAAQLTRGTPCERLIAWYAERDREISANIVAQVRHNPGRRIAVVTGADHHGPVVAALRSLGSSIVLVPVPETKPAPPK